MDAKENFSYLDGVPFTIGPKFCPPPSVVLPLAINYELPPELLSQKYDFDVETKVVKAALQEEENKKLEASSRSESSESQINSAAKNPGNHNALSWNADSILQPSSQTQNKNSEDASSAIPQNVKKINLSDFENDMTSPFDYMELQTINDLEELNTVFQGLCDTRRESVAPDPNVESENPSSSVSHYPIHSENQMSNVSKSISFPLSQNFNGPNLENNVNSQAIDNTSENYLSSYSSPNTPGVLTDSTSLPLQEDYLKRNSFHGGEINFSSSALPPVPSLHANQNFGYGYSSGYTFDNNMSLRSSKSIPDLTNLNPLEEAGHSKTLRSHTPPAKCGYVHTDISNRRDFANSENSSSNLVTNNSISSNGESEHHPMNLPDPYNELNDPEKETVNSIYAMGFDRGQVSRTVKHLGTDSKKVVEHLCQIQVLEESGYDKLEAEAALHLHDYNKNEAIRFLDLLNQFQDLGFEKNAIKKALIQNKNDRDKVIDALLSS